MLESFGYRLSVGLLRAALLPGMAQRKRRPGTTTPRPVSPWASPPHQPVPRPTAGEGPGRGPAATRADRGTGAPWWGGGRPLRRAGLSSGPQAPAAAWGVSCARPRWLPCLRRGRGVVGWCRGLRQAGPASAALWQDVRLAPVAVGGAAHCRAVVPCGPPPGAWCRVSDPLVSALGPGGIWRPGWCRRRWVAAVGPRDARAPASVLSTPTRACRRRWLASAPASLRLPTAPDA